MPGSNQPVAAPQMTLVAVPAAVTESRDSLTTPAVNVATLCAEYEQQLFPLLDEGARLLGRAQETKPGAVKLAFVGEDVKAALEKIEPFFANIDKSINAISSVRESFAKHFTAATQGKVDIAKLEAAVKTTLEQAKALVGEAHKLVGPPEQPLSLEEKKDNLRSLSADEKRVASLNQLHKTLEANALKAKNLEG